MPASVPRGRFVCLTAAYALKERVVSRHPGVISLHLEKPCGESGARARINHYVVEAPVGIRPVEKRIGVRARASKVHSKLKIRSHVIGREPFRLRPRS